MSVSLLLRPGASGESVRDLQRRLAAAGHPAAGDPPGTYGPATEAAIRAFQEHRGLRVDGLCGEQTWASLVEAGHCLGDRLLSLRAPMERGDDVAELQQLLGSLGFDAGRVDGILGPATAAAIADFQRNAGLITDGVCGPETVAGLRRFASRAVGEGEGATIATLREVESLRAAPPHLAGRRVVVGERGGAGALADALGRALSRAGAVVTVVRHPDDSGQAAAANAFAAEAFLGLVVRDAPGAACAFYENGAFSSPGGRRLAELASDVLVGAGLEPVDPARGMRFPVLRETRMPAVVVEVGDPPTVVGRSRTVAAALAEAFARWAKMPV